MSIHNGISCDYCRKINFSGRRYKCLICNDFDLCSICYDKKSTLSFLIHSNYHPMQLIITSNDSEYIYFGSKYIKQYSFSLTCSICNKNGFSFNLFLKHIKENHLTLNYSVLCPICFIRQNNLLKHLYLHINENNNFKIKKIKILNFDEKELKLLNKSNQQESLLEKLINYQENKIENEKRYLFISSLLTNLLNENFFFK